MFEQAAAFCPRVRSLGRVSWTLHRPVHFSCYCGVFSAIHKPTVLFLATGKAPVVGGTRYKAFGARVRGIGWDRKDGFSGGVLSALTEDLDLVPRTYIGQLTTL